MYYSHSHTLMISLVYYAIVKSSKNVPIPKQNLLAIYIKQSAFISLFIAFKINELSFRG